MKATAAHRSARRTRRIEEADGCKLKADLTLLASRDGERFAAILVGRSWVCRIIIPVDGYLAESEGVVFGFGGF
jgi:hypothetical protein